MRDAKEADPETATGEPLDTHPDAPRPDAPRIEENDPGEQEKLEQDTGLLTDGDDERIGDAG